jgi:hypothetical protein
MRTAAELWEPLSYAAESQDLLKPSAALLQLPALVKSGHSTQSSISHYRIRSVARYTPHTDHTHAGNSMFSFMWSLYTRVDGSEHKGITGVHTADCFEHSLGQVPLEYVSQGRHVPSHCEFAKQPDDPQFWVSSHGTHNPVHVTVAGRTSVLNEESSTVQRPRAHADEKQEQMTVNDQTARVNTAPATEHASVPCSGN